MQILLLENIAKIGKKGEIIMVAEGYGRNFILKKKLGVIPNNQDIAKYKSNQFKQETIAKERLLNFQNLQSKLENYELTLKVYHIDFYF